MAAESQVGCINYELKNTSNQSLDSASSSNVKAQKLQFSREIRVKIIAKVFTTTSALIKIWNEFRCQLQQDGISEKADEN